MKKMEKTLPRPPTVVAEVIRTAADPEAGPADLAEIIAKDPVLSAEILRSVNSSYYALPSQVSSVSSAVAYMGVRAARNLVLCLGIKEAIPASEASKDYPLQTFWEGSLRRGASAKCIASALGFPKNELDEMFTLGLCQDLGILVQLNNDPAIASGLGAVINQPFWERLSVEHGFKTSHDEVGSDLLTAWNLPDDISIAV